MKKLIFVLAVLMTLVGAVAYNQFATNNTLYELVWEDEFDQDQLDMNVWTPVIGDGCPGLCGWGNNEMQYYSDSEKNIRIEDGKLMIVARQEKMGGKSFTSGKLVTKNKADWKYGRIEVRAMLPYGKGTWSAIWMLPTVNEREREWPQDGEIDIMEHVGYDPGTVLGTLHSNKYNGSIGTQKPDSIFLKSANKEFHTYSIEWTDESIIWFADDVEFHRLNKENDDLDGWPFNQFNCHLILNLAVGGNWGRKYGIDEEIWPQTFTIDYVRYYELKNE